MHNDLKVTGPRFLHSPISSHVEAQALLLSHPHFLIRDTQVLASKHNLVKSRLPALRHLVEQEFGVAIQTGEHSSVRSYDYSLPC